jgi:hypothetical protein
MIGSLYAAAGVGLIALGFSRTVALVLAGVVLLAAAALLIIDWDGR